MSVRDALDNAFSDWFHGEGVENKTDDSPGDAAIAALRALPPEEIAKALEWETRDGRVDAYYGIRCSAKGLGIDRPCLVIALPWGGDRG